MRDISLETVIVALTYIDAYDRDTWLKVGNALKTEFGTSGFDVFDNWSQTTDNYDAKAIKSVWRSLTIGKVNIGTVIFLAKQRGFDIHHHESKPIDPQEQAARQAKREQQERESIAHEQAEKKASAELLPQIEQVANTALSTPFTHDKGISTTQTLSIHSNELHAFKHPFNQHNGKPESIGFALKGLVTLVPYLDLKTGELVKLQGISGIKATEGKEAGKYIKRFIGKGDGYYWRGDILKQDAPKVIIEGFSDAQTVYEYTHNRYASLAAGNDTALMKAALSLRALCPSAVIIVFGDNDLSGKGQRLAKAAALAVNGICLLPPSQYKDVNEWVLAEGAEGLNKMIDEAIEKTVTERSRSEKAVPPSQDGTAPLNDDLASESIGDGGDGGEKKPPKPMLRVVTIGQLVGMELPPRENLLAPWLPMQGLAMVYAPRGIGKTFFALNVAYAVASGGEFLCWQAPQAQTVLYIDGEMPVNSMQERLGSIIAMHQAEANEDALRIMTPDLQQDIFMPDLATIEGQQAIEPFLEGVKLIVIDNISTLCRSGRENESEGWITVQEWALRQRSAGRSVLFVHHAGKGGNQRGTSKREDVLDTVINLKRPIDYNPSEGASFEVHFEKTRGFSGEDAEPLSCRLGYDQHNNPAWLYSRLEDSTFDKVVTLINEGLTQAEIVIELDINKSNISRHVKKARLQGLIQEPKTKSKPVNSANYSRARDGE
jgi:putative DNA primase/helicase